MSFAKALFQSFDSQTKSRGQDYFLNQRVRFITQAGPTLNFTVLGSDIYSVEIAKDFSSGSFNLYCSCPFFADGNNCKHLWAAILKADQLNDRKALTLQAVDSPISWQNQLQFALKKKSQEEGDYSFSSSKKKSPEKTALYAINLQECQNKKSIILNLYVREKLKSGDWGKIKAADLDQSKIEDFSESEEREILWELLGKSTETEYYFTYRKRNQFGLIAGQTDILLRKISTLGKLKLIKSAYYNSKPSESDFLPLSYDENIWALGLDLSKLQENYLLKGEITSSQGERKSLDEVLGYAGPYLFLPGKIARCDLAQNHFWLHFFAKGPLTLNEVEKNDFLHYFFREHANRTPLSLPPDSQFKDRLDLEPAVRLIIETPNSSNTFYVKFGFCYEQSFVRHNSGQFLYVAGKKEKIHRKLDFENQAYEKFLQLEILPVDDPQYQGFIPANRFTEIIEKAVELGWECLALDKKVQNPREFNIEFTSGIDWFDVQIELQYGNQWIGVPQLLAAIEAGQRLIQLDDGTTGILPQDWLKRIAPFLQNGQISEQGLRLSKVQSLFFSASFDQNIHFSGDNKFQTLMSLVQDINNLEAKEASKKFKGKLRNYQKQGLAWLHMLSENQLGGVLADDMGLGKTIQVLALLSARQKKQNPNLIVAPKSLLHNWQSEAEKFTPHFKVLVHAGSNRSTSSKDFVKFDLVITTYQTLRIDIEALRTQHFDFFVLDEAHNVKNAQAQIAMAARLIQAKNRIALTGTPVENSLMDLFSIMEVVNPGLISTAMAQRWIKEKDPETIQRLGKSLSPFLLRRTKAQVLKDLPEKSEQVLYAELSAPERKKYDELKAHYWLNLTNKIAEKGLAKSKIEVLEALLRLRQAACHVGLLDKKLVRFNSAKFEVLLEQLDSVLREGHKALIFSQFTSLLELLSQQLHDKKIKFEYLDGQTKDRAERVQKFQSNDQIQVFLLSLKAGGVGLNLTAADYVFILDPWWNPAAESQAIDRAHRIGQNKKVFAYKIIAKDTVEEKILELQGQKKQIAQAIISADSSLLKSLQLKDLQELFS